MSKSEDSPLQIHKRFATLEHRMTQIEAAMGQFNNVIDPQGWISEAFDVLDGDLTILKSELTGLREDMQSFDRNLDTIFQHITGMN